LAVKDYRKRIDVEHQGRVDILEKMAYATIPFRVDPEVAAARKKAKRLAKSRKHQSKLWDAELQEQIRAERASRRLASDSQETVPD
jgi:hypothetical protein